MAAPEALLTLTWGGLAERRWSDEGEGEESMGMMRARLQAMTWASQAKDASLEYLQRRLHAALQEAEQGRIREAALQRRAEKAEQAEEALASQMGELEAEAFTSITESNKLLAAYQRAAEASDRRESRHVEPSTPRVGEVHSRLQEALEEAAAWAQRCRELEEVVEEGRRREAALGRRAEKAEEALASEMAELEAEAVTCFIEGNKRCAAFKEPDNSLLVEQPMERRHVETEPIVNSDMASETTELQKRLVEAKGELEAVHAKLRESEEKKRLLELRLVGEQQVTLMQRKEGAAVLSLSLHIDLAGFVKLKLWNPSSLSLAVFPSHC